MILSKIGAAEIQLDSAIKLFFELDYVSSTTLAGAAEDILAGLLKERGQQAPFEYLHEWYQKTYNTVVPKTEFSQQIANPTRNWLKHADRDADTELDIGEGDSIMMLMRALPCYFLLTKRHTEMMKRFNQHICKNIAEIDKLFSEKNG